jgi:uncharacterized protein (UPF0212 family)
MALCECEYCQNIFNGAGGQKICPNCTKMLDGVFAQARKFMYSTHEKVTVEKLVTELDVPEKAIEYLIRQKRLVIEPRGNGSGRCRICGAPTDGQALCEKCRSVVSSSMQKLEAEKEEKLQREQERRAMGRGIKPLTTYGRRETDYRKEGGKNED